MYIRNFKTGIDLPWQEVFQTDDKEKVADYCGKNNIEYQWLSDEHLRTKQIAQATLTHPKTKEKVWFNQANLFHVSALSKEMKQQLLSYSSIEDLPRNAFLGNGEEISEEMLAEINHVIESEVIKFPWQKFDLLLVDNILMTHGRNSYEGERKAAVAMG